MAESKKIVLFYPHLPVLAREAARAVMNTRWIGQGPMVDEFETRFEEFFQSYPAIAVGSGTDALHLAYILAGIKDGDEVLAPVFTCTATNIPLLYQRANIKFVDINPDSLNISVDDIKHKLTEKTKAIVVVDYGGLPCDMDEINTLAHSVGAKVIEDAAHSLGAKYKGTYVGSLTDYNMFSFQAIKSLTTADGGMLTLKNPFDIEKAKRIRWFGIDRQAKHKGIWDNDITELGYKYQMTDISAAMGVAGLRVFESHLAHKAKLFRAYQGELEGIKGIKIINGNEPRKVHAHWMLTVSIEDRKVLERKLRENGVECDQVHYRNDRYSIFGTRRSDLPNMDAMEDKYEVLPMHGAMDLEEVEYICKIIKEGW